MGRIPLQYNRTDRFFYRWRSPLCAVELVVGYSHTYLSLSVCFHPSCCTKSVVTPRVLCSHYKPLQSLLSTIYCPCCWLIFDRGPLSVVTGYLPRQSTRGESSTDQGGITRETPLLKQTPRDHTSLQKQYKNNQSLL